MGNSEATIHADSTPTRVLPSCEQPAPRRIRPMVWQGIIASLAIGTGNCLVTRALAGE